MRALLVVLCASLAMSLAAVAADRREIVRDRMNGLRGRLVGEVNSALCNSCDVSRNKRRAKCKCHLDGCSGRFDHVRVDFDDSGRMVTWVNLDH
jgi:hypothetical protein